MIDKDILLSALACLPCHYANIISSLRDSPSIPRRLLRVVYLRLKGELQAVFYIWVFAQKDLLALHILKPCSRRIAPH